MEAASPSLGEKFAFAAPFETILTRRTASTAVKSARSLVLANRFVRVIFFDDRPAFLGGFRVLEEVEVLRRYNAVFGQFREINDVFPKFATEKNDRQMLHSFGLAERQRFEEFVEGAEAAGERDERLGAQEEVQLPNREVMKIEA